MSDPSHPPTNLREALIAHFNLDELDRLCFDLRIDPERLPHRERGLDERAHQLILYLRGQRRLADLVLSCRKLRPHVADDWQALVDALPKPNVRNPFFAGGRINDPAQFFGRERLLRELRGDLSALHSVSIVGEAQIGKSSLLYHLYNTRQSWSGEAQVEYVDLQGMWNQEDFCGTLLDRLGQTGNSPMQLSLAVRTHLRQGGKLIWLMDECERLAEPDIDPRLLDMLRALSQERHFALGLVTQRPLIQVFPPRSASGVSPFHNVFSHRSVERFSDEEALTLLRERLAESGVAFSDGEIADLLRECAGHPAQLQRRAREVFERYMM